MKRTNDEFRAEIFSRSDKIIKKRKKIKRIALCCAPLFLCAVISVYIIMLSGGMKNVANMESLKDNSASRDENVMDFDGAAPEAELSGNSNSDKNTGSITHVISSITIENCKTGITTHISDQSVALDMECLIAGITEKAESAEKTVEADYNITLHCSAGESSTYSIAGNTLIYEDKLYKISYAELKKLLDIIENH